MSSALERRVLGYIRRHELLRPGDRAAVAVSGGADSVALLRLMVSLRAELGVVLSVAHFNHKIRAEASDADEGFVRTLAATHGLEFYSSCADVPAFARARHLSLETAARELRYEFFGKLIASGAISKVVTAHTLDDQAETVLMRVIRGTGTAGLSGIYPRLKVPGADATAPAGEIIRPLLNIRRCEIEAYLRSLGQSWHEDATNMDVHHVRNRVRHVLLPLLESDFNPAIRNRLAELADVARVEEDYWHSLLREISVAHDPATLDAEALVALAPALQRRVIRKAGDDLSLDLDFESIDAIQRLALGEIANVELPGGWRVVREIVRRPSGGRSGFYLHFVKSPSSVRPGNYEYSFTWPGELAVAEAGMTLSARTVVNAPTSADVLDPQKLAPELTVRNWRPGDQFWPSHTSGPRKVKELLQRRHITGPERALWPVVVSGEEIVWMRGFPVSENYRATSREGLLLDTQATNPAKS